VNILPRNKFPVTALGERVYVGKDLENISFEPRTNDQRNNKDDELFMADEEIGLGLKVKGTGSRFPKRLAK